MVSTTIGISPVSSPEVDVPADGLERLYRRARRRRQTRITGLVTAVLVVAVAAVSVGLSVTGGPSAEHANVTGGGGAPQGVVVFPPAPASAARGATALDANGIRLWLPPSWTSSPRQGRQCPTQGAVGPPSLGEAGDLSFAPCDRASVAQLTIGVAGSTPSSAVRTRINGIEVAEYHPSRQPDVEVVNVAALDGQVTATTAAARAIVATLQPSAAADILAGPAHPATPAGWRQVTYNGVAFDVPPTWPVLTPTEGSCEPVGYGGAVVDLGIPTSTPGCKVGRGIDTRAYDGLQIGRSPAGAASDSTFPSGAPLTIRHDGTVTVSATDTPAVPQLSEPPGIVADVRTTTATLSLTLDVGPDPTTAATILGSIRPVGSAPPPTTTTTSHPPPAANGALPAVLRAERLPASVPFRVVGPGPGRARSKAGPRYLKPGTPVPAVDVGAQTAATNQVSYGLAGLYGSDWPAISTDGGRQWRIDGPLNAYEGEQGPSYISTIGTVGADVAYTWGHGGTSSRSRTTPAINGGTPTFPAGSTVSRSTE